MMVVAVEATSFSASKTTTTKTSSTKTIQNKDSEHKQQQQEEDEQWWIRVVETQHRRMNFGKNHSITSIATDNDDEEEWGDSEWTTVLSLEQDGFMDSDEEEEEDPTMDNKNNRLIVVPSSSSSSLSTSTKTMQPIVIYTLPYDQEFVGEWELDHHSDMHFPSSTAISTRHRKKKSKTKTIDGWKYSMQQQHSTKSKIPSSSSSINQKNNRTFPLLQYDTRQRVWMRKVRYKKEEETTTTTTQRISQPKKQHRHPTWKIVHPKTIQKIHNFWMDEYNFKGLGFVLYKSLIARKGNYGMGIRIPITSNFGFWERRSHWPSITCSMAIYYPWLFVWTWNASVRMELIQWTCQIIHHVVPAMATAMFVLVLRGLALAVSALLFPFTRKPLLMTHQHPKKQTTTTATAVPAWKTIWEQGPRYSRTAEERIGISWNWRYTPTSFELRKQIYHQYMPSIAALVNQVQNVLGGGGGGPEQNAFLLDWIRRRSAAFGWSITGPVPDPGFIVSMTGALALSGFHLKLFPLTKTIANKKSTPLTVPHLSPTMSSTSAVTGKTKLHAKAISESLDSASLISHSNISVPILSTTTQETNDSNTVPQLNDPEDDKLVATAAKKATKVKGGGGGGAAAAAAASLLSATAATTNG
jgi:hypothetical protein